MQTESLTQVALQTLLLAVLYALRKLLKDGPLQVRPEPREAHGTEARVRREAVPHRNPDAPPGDASPDVGDPRGRD